METGEMISILMPIYNGIEFINESVPSIMQQTFTEWELIIGINGHPENSEVYLTAKEYELMDDRIKVYDLHTIRGGKSATLNHMLTLCKFDWISLLDVDDMWVFSKLESQAPWCAQYDVIGTLCQYFGENDAIPSIPSGDITAFDFFKVNPVINSSCLLKKELCAWDGNFDGVEDYDLWLRLWKQGRKFYNVNQIEVKHRIHRASAFNANGNDSKLPQLRQKYQ